MLSHIGAFSVECLLIEAEYSLNGARVFRTQEHLKELYARPEGIRIDNRTESTSSAVDACALARTYRRSYRRRTALLVWLLRYNEKRPRTDMGVASPITLLPSVA